MEVYFWRDDERAVSGWEVRLPKRRPVTGGVMALGRGTISHDLLQYVVEAACDYPYGFWGLVAKGATFRTMAKTATKPGRAVIVAHRQALIESEQLAGLHAAAWQRGAETPVTAALSSAAAQFQQLQLGDRLAFDWPSSKGRVLSG